MVEPKSQGMKGTHIKVLNEYLWHGVEELAEETEMNIDEMFAEYGRKLTRQYAEAHAKEHNVSGGEIRELANKIWESQLALNLDIVDLTDIDLDKGYRMYAEENGMDVAEVNPEDMLAWYLRKFVRK